MPNTVVVGLDGANWDLLQPWLDDGDLPNIASLRNSGVDADLQSCLPPVTCPNWRCYSTGKNPGKLGVYWWEKIDAENRTLSTPNSRSFKSANFWDYLNEDGQTAGVVNLPMSYPPFELDGFMVAGGPGSEQTDYTTPPDLGDELDAAGYDVHPDVAVTSSEDTDAADAVVDLIDQRLETYRRLLDEREVDVAHCTVFYVNVLQHYFWRDEPTYRAWQVIDEHLGAIRQEHPDATLVLLSDHGCDEIDTMFYANTWLEQEGFLHTKTDATSAFERLGINKKRVLKIAERFGAQDLIAKITPEFVKSQVPMDEEGAKREHKLDRVDWSKSRAIASGQGLIYVLDGAESTRDEIMDRLADLESDVSGTPIAREVLTREEAYDGPYVEDAPEIVFDQTPGIHTSGAIGDNPVFEDVSHWRAENVRTGLFLADGPDVTASAVEEPVPITAVAPTVLHSVGCPIPEDVDGMPLALFDGEEPIFRDPITPEFLNRQGSDGVEDRLEDLGYLQ
ncbi:type I phosphodiesterase/nucleotide pyrophosphatase [Salinarchaeum sp. Harcht-Bsk1]|uniref:alkaline phosphatase family protein n=1 Tax=Salinarchaeum sp. Harcht-Bsk1 TaxID=1333523 RepID=UPI0003422F32|nr:alkaline phosphatase family protein [Salinarchaeum sp. Harcht-Bsk1]AGN00943.1 type I phosphodiesterase/nucleotide pyrophosphatase [Salinarchaeum sp. Harcht-Bsk1]